MATNPDSDKNSYEDSPSKSELFPTTRWTLVLRTLDSDSREEALAQLCSLYWSPVYFFIRKRGEKQHDAEDLTQGFFEQMLARKQLQRAAESPDSGRLRSYLLKSVQNFLINQNEKNSAIKRGGKVEKVSIDATKIERQFSEVGGDSNSPEELFDREWASNVLARAFSRLESDYREAGKSAVYDTLKSTFGQNPEEVPFPEMAEALNLTENATRVAAYRLRKQFRGLVQDEIRETAASESDFEEEMNYLRKLLGG